MLAMVLLLLGCQDQTPLPKEPYPLGRLDGPTLSGERLDLAALSGKVVVVNFWSPT